MDQSSLTPMGHFRYTSDKAPYPLMRYLMSDTVSPSLDKSIAANINPLMYASQVLDGKGMQIFTKFAVPAGAPESTPLILKKAWVFTAVLEAALIYRISHVRPKREEDILALLFQVQIYTLIIDSGSLTYAQYLGIINFANIVNCITDNNPDEIASKDHALLCQMVNAVGDIPSQTNVLQDKTWSDALHYNPIYMETLRGFLFVATKYLIQATARYNDDLIITRSQVIRDIWRFIDLRGNESTSMKEVLKFLNDVESYSLDIHDGRNEAIVLCAGMDDFVKMHHALYSDHYQFSERVIQKPHNDFPEWELLRSLGEDAAPENIIQTMQTPGEYVDHVLKTYYSSNYEKVFVPFCQSRDVKIAPSKPSRDFWTIGAIEDALYCSAITRRYIHDSDTDYDTAHQVVCNEAHILLSRIDEHNSRSGLSMVSSLLEFHISQTDFLTEDEMAIALDFKKGWSKLRLDKPQKIPAAMKSILKNNDQRDKLRHLAFFVLEALQIPPEISTHRYLGMGRDIAFSCIAYFAEQLNVLSEFEEDWRDCLSKAPKVEVCYSIELLDFHVWMSSFAIVNTYIAQQEHDCDD